jgi:hypothetical protein
MRPRFRRVVGIGVVSPSSCVDFCSDPDECGEAQEDGWRCTHRREGQHAQVPPPFLTCSTRRYMYAALQ